MEGENGTAMVKKPTGNEGWNGIEVKEDGSAELSFERVSLGNDKVEIERGIMERFGAAMLGFGSRFTWIQNGENDLDFALTFKDGALVDMDLTELILPAAKGSPFDQPNRARTFGAVADAVEQLVRRKDAHYSLSGRPKHLLVYTTHWSFMPTWQVLRLVQVAFLNAPPKALEKVFFLYSVGEGDSPVLLHPAVPEPVATFSADGVRDMEFVRLDPALAKLEAR
jgi:hypothetical protein